MKNFKYLLTLFFFSFLLFGMWEWIQTPFFLDSSKNINDIVWFRIHCTLGDILILTTSLLVWSLFKREFSWVFKPHFSDYFAVTLLGTLYTSFSEIFNVVIKKSWGYSNLMPLIPHTRIGIVPIIQWIILPTVTLYIAKRFSKNGIHR